MTRRPHRKVVALVPAYNAAGFIDRTLDALAAQTWPNIEVLISDDGSTDRTVAICSARTAADPRFRLIRQHQNLGWIGNSNALLAAADPAAEYLLFAFHDDLVLPGYIEALVTRLEDNPGSVVAYSDMIKFYESGDQEHCSFVGLDGIASNFDRARAMVWQPENWWVPNRGVFRASAARAIGGLKKHRRGEFSADWPWLTALAARGGFERIPETLCHKFYKTSSVSRAWSFDPDAFLAAAGSVAAEIRASDLTVYQKARIHFSLMRKCRDWYRRRNEGHVAARR